ncbi:glucose 1-dehydrogenase [Mycobacterium talmoniae]|uniref:3-alpha-(Or 20-beta)-hydroxysteroid dehydrogenase n=1 Tax=Mycobacterium talmoniae TaxID=1858794 RepID=A0A1S1NQL0_9MYCO|nr:glucose 1-dehydrogenase [Mycobacterium talmoniae]OHV06929.1 3-alpha-hydroxysteroid dehydrogenase [Mycobacterium talmoniae]PQM48011.1 3-alpha-(or 20-beta)-hydroxysteroid dehydrogenase [Mycobacterium talmoniae]
MSKRVADKVAVVTGGAGGIGGAAAKALAAEGAHVLITDIADEQGKATADEIGGRFVRHDVTDADAWAAVMTAAEEAFGPVNILVNSAGIQETGPIAEITLDDYQRVMAINATSVFLGIKAVVPAMRRSGGGSIVNISSAAGLVAVPTALAYVASKFAVRGITKAAAMELGPDKIRVNSVHPGAIRTPMLASLDNIDVIEASLPMLPLGRAGEADEIANLILFLASDESSYSTGAEFLADGGWTSQ